MSRVTYIGIDPGDRRQPFTFAALDGERTILALSQGPMDAVLAYAAGQAGAITAINGPLCFNQGRMAQEKDRAGLNPPPRPGEWTDLRVVEYQLALRQAPVSHTPSGKGYCPKWIRRAVELSTELQQRLGFSLFDDGEEPCHLLEAQAEVCFWSLLGGTAPFAAGSLEGRLQRQLVLHDEKLPVPDPMDFFEEVTRFKLLKGILPVKDVYSQPELNALVTAYTAWLTVNKPERVETVGASEEGKIWLPMQRN
jgi:hypothetical protein